MTQWVGDEVAAFDPRGARAVDNGGSVLHRPAEGLGLMLIHRVACRLAYEWRRDITGFTSMIDIHPGIADALAAVA